MISNPVLETMMNHRSVRKFKTRCPSLATIRTIAPAGRQAAFSSQLYSVIYIKKGTHAPFKAPLTFYVCVDAHKLELFMKKRGWTLVTNDLTLLLFGIQDACYMAQNMVLAAESLELGTVYLGHPIVRARALARELGLPKRVLPLVAIAMGYPAEEFPPRARYPLDFVLFKDRYPRLSDQQVKKAMKAMDDGYLGEGYYRRLQARISLSEGRRETFTLDDYSWTEHISRKWGQWHTDLKAQQRELKGCGFDVVGRKSRNRS
jgi:nitroreductase